MIQYTIDSINIKNHLISEPNIVRNLGRYSGITSGRLTIDMYDDNFLFATENPQSLLNKKKDDLSKIIVKIYDDETNQIYWSGVVDNIERVDSRIIRIYSSEIFIKILGKEYCEYNINDAWAGAGSYAEPGIPNTPIDVAASALTSGSIRISWITMSDDLHKETGYRLYFSSNGGATWSAAIILTTNAYIHTGLLPATEYQYKIESYNTYGTSSISDIAIATTYAQAIFEKEPYLMFHFLPLTTPSTVHTIDNTKMKISFQSTAPAYDVKIEWGTTLSYGNTSGNITPKTPAPADGDYRIYSYSIYGLTPNTLYYYKATLDGVIYTNSFYSAPLADTNKVTIYAMGDTQAVSPTYIQAKDDMAALILADMAASPGGGVVFLHAGDMVYEGTEAEWQNYFFDPAYTNWCNLLAKIPLHGIRGGHENLPGIEDDPTTYRKYLFAVPGRDRYNFNFGPALLCLLCNIDDTDPYNFFWIGTEQYNDLNWALTNTSKPFKLCMWHVPAYSAGGNHINDPATKSVHDATVALNNVDVVLNGHNHYFAHTRNNGIDDFTIGGGGAPNYPTAVLPDPNYPGIIYTQTGYGATPPLFFYIKIVFENFGSSTATTLTVVKDDGTIIYTYTA